MVVLVTGASGQLGQSIAFIASKYPEIQFIFASSNDLDITNEDRVTTFFDQNSIDYCINTAAYTAVDKAESESDKAYRINVLGSQYLAKACQKSGTTLLHISTDFVFDGTASVPYTETDTTNPIGIYGKTKLEGENEVTAHCDKHFIIRTSWVYSQFGNNFMKTMLRLALDRDALNVVNDQIGTPTNAVDLAETLLTIIQSNSTMYGIYNFSNEGVCSWYDFAKEIFRVNAISTTVNPIPTEAYPTPAKRPAYSVLDKTKIKTIFDINIKSWQESLLQTK
ncbi:dTDP-4-dehydrorhamnose reductase [Flavobacterium luminosum]|uniref:dTDP-4-dehydrorhamnose reductase n=1 Tax=Flavobacterium luminosum TaxID=2949086 RepID=A0ABT0TR10_9FLAO|nr:dTDP-4-dehydrorhamnose reductase [Flavobacterium sp. HXWNR70]MCL9809928.1 dTDP-4-dehydrorhamnose reductase [Flavobacterium sp. HXWNR70]